MYIKRKEDCHEIDTGHGVFAYELVGRTNGNTEKHSIAHIDIPPHGYSEAHMHPKAEESYIILEGKGRLVIDGEERIVQPGDVAKIPVGKAHQIFNDFQEKLSLYCVCAPAWTPECSIPVEHLEKSPKEEKPSEIWVKRKEECEAIKPSPGEVLYELLGRNNGDAEQHSIAQVEMFKDSASAPHFHPETEESYIIMEGQGRLVVDNEERIITKGDVATIPIGKTHQIFNEYQDTLVFFAVCAPAWTPECAVYIKA